jgi:hypothetical protein
MRAGCRLISNVDERPARPSGIILKFGSRPARSNVSPRFIDNLPAISGRTRGTAIVRIAEYLAEDSSSG